MITGLNHVTLAVRDLERSFRFYTEVLQCRPLARWRSGAYLLAGELWLCLSLDETTRPEPLPEYTHLAFDVPARDFGRLAARIHSAEALLWKDDRSEGDSLYFLDPDGHKLEIHVGDWRSRLAAMRRSPWDSETVFFD
ncbi:Glyoxalase/Bleomycin resistance protein/Dioxygenase superfamily protein [Tistlia consotensis]|uniref:Glyoxalase/Bleomycin resistance protein/Dioxygenase superfamily protein n=1 Tax=Tistlia consotensis USBA 355 TaxID=560819 RepID=A0A1Y6CDW8_9PROT|nr:fosfomycin resistance glutathione transferase [Tistlia consotensis]SMF58716.1 Glyoxalase/Bleomycin resistance protein/Dioxygenase superfamily protein [Tistlia consotensis USBA 355]SNR63698.1 Glyoxalase/Bleomycin resistance protein/Dioxygenase superfamily protein [Tistlia consotensis]